MRILSEVYNKIKTKSLSRRVLIVLGFISGVVAILSLFSEAFARYFWNEWRIELQHTPFALISLLISLGSFALVYLQSGSDDLTSRHERDLLGKLDRYREITDKQLASTQEELRRFESKLDTSGPDKVFSKADKVKIAKKIIEKTSIESIKGVFNSEVADLKVGFEQESVIDKLLTSSEGVINRLKREISDLRLRSNINLILGMLITLGGLYLLWTTVNIVDSSDLLKTFATEGDESNFKFLKSLILPIVPRFLLVIFVEIFAYFFLRLYKDGLSEIKYFQNELTNIESKFYSVMFAYLTKSVDSLKTSLTSLSQKERNFVLEKGQTTVELEKAKSESALTQNIIKNIPAVFKKANK